MSSRFFSNIFKPTTTEARICNDNLKYLLLNLLQPPLDAAVQVQRRRTCYRQMYDIIRTNSKSNVKSEHIYTILYSRYFTTRYMVGERLANNNHGEENIEDDSIIKDCLKDICSAEYASKTHFEESYLTFLKKHKKDVIFKEYESVNKLIISHAKFSEEDKALFYEGTTSTDIYINRKISKDIPKFASLIDNIKRFLSDWRFVNAWISSTGTIFIGGVLTYMGMEIKVKK